jgi:Zn-dependent M28 family amino/carboxypeptidase
MKKKLINIVATGILTSQVCSATPPVEPASRELRHELAAAVSAERIETDIRKLVGFGTRHTLSDTESDIRGIGAARRWVEQEFKNISGQCGGCLEVFTVGDVISGERRIPEPTEVVNVIAIQRGTLDPERMVLMAGDIDSIPRDHMDYTSDSPGANDNASGLAGTIEAARVLSKHRFAGSIIYAALSGEEQGLFGGKILAERALEDGWRIKAVLNNDMIGNISGLDGVTDNSTARVFSEGTRYVETEEEASLRRNLARYVDRMADEFIPNLDVMMIYRLDRFGRGGHHRPFNERGIPGVRIMETHEHYHRQHEDVVTENGIAYGDVIEFVDFDYARKLTALNVVSLAGMASAPPFPANVDIEGAVQPSTTLSWSIPEGKAAENLAGYKVYWRLTTEPQWTFSRYVGLVDTYILENVVIDNYLFGVASVSTDGYESPVVFPGATGSFGE